MCWALSGHGKDWKWGRWGSCLAFVKAILSVHSSLPTGYHILTSTNRHTSKGGRFVKLSQIYKTAIFNDISFFTPNDPYMETDPFFFPPVSGNSWKAKATSWVGEETGEVLTCRQAGDPGKSHRQEEPDWLWPLRSRLGAQQLKDVSKPHSDHHRVLEEIAQKYGMLWNAGDRFIACSFVFSLRHKMHFGPELYLTYLFEGYCI